MAHNYKITFGAELDISQMKGALNQLQQQLADLKFPASMTKGVTETFSKLSDEIKNFEELRNKGVKSPADFAKLEASGEKIISLYEKLKKSAGDLSKLSGKDLEKLFPQSVVDTIEKARKALAAYEGEVKKAATKVDDLNKKIQAQQNLVKQASAKKETAEAAMPDAQTELNNASKAIQDKTGLTDTSEALKKLIEDYNKAAEAAKKYEDAVANGEKISPAQKGVITKKNNLEALIKTYSDAAQRVKVLQDAINNAQSDIDKGVGEIDKLNESLKKAQAEQDVAKSNALTSLLNSMKELDGIDMSKYDQSLEGAKQALEDFINANGAAAKGQIENFLNALEASGVNVDDLRKKLAELGQEVANTDARMKDVQALKSRIQYFFGLQNSINLVKRAIRSAFNTIKELDQVMTETAVVTDFSVSDMWSQLPEYTKRANELGVTTKAAYEAATLYYQQGLKTNEVNALSVETLKMARIAGLDAAEATDRMTNALRGFNMELTEANAQRVDDVYSELAANTASNVDEISTAMTKVASLAHNANMEFETTAAFLAQIIETTRESAETAGTALKTVVARFSEVKKLMSEGQLTGTDEEGQAIDVNRVGAALRTAGIDLNKYFLGEVGLDDIFMELASKWDSLTSVQQRYIATQAAGSRQQSRFIAMMQDYARTQELVGKAYASSGASEKQFEKTQESLESKLNRLKNAWNEFLMGLTNNQVIKGAVDLLTEILNTINKLTDSFGEAGSGIAKWVVAIGGLKAVGSLFKDGGLFDKILGNSFLGKFLGLEGGQSLFNFKKIDFSDLEGLQKSIDSFKASFKSFGSGIIDVSGAIDKFKLSISNVGQLLVKYAVPLASIAVYIAAIAGFVYGAVKMRDFEIERADPASAQKKQLELTKQNAEAMKEWTDRTEEQSRALKEIQNTQTGNFANINEAQTTSEYREAIQAQNDYIKSLIEKDAQYSQYVQSIEGINGEIILTLDEQALAEACNLAAEAAVKSATASQFSQSAVASGSNAVLQANLDALQKKYYSTDENGETKYYRRSEADAAVTPYGTYYIPEVTVEISKEEYQGIMAQEEAIIAEQQKNSQQAQINATNAFSQMGWHLELDPSTINTISTALGSAFDASKYSQAILDSIAQQEAFYKNNNFSEAQTKADLRQKYYESYGVQAADTLDIPALMNALATYDQSTKQMQQTKDFAGLINADEAAKQMALAFTGQIEGQEQLFTWGEDDVSALDPVAEKIRQALGLGVDDFVKKYKEAQTGVKNRKTRAKGQYYNAALRSGATIDQNTQNQIQSLNLQDVERLGEIAETLRETISPEGLAPILEQLPNVGSEQLEEINTFLQDLNLENPIQAFTQLKTKLDEVGESSALGNIITQIQDTNSELFTASNLVQSFIASADYSSIAEELDNLIKENGSISPDNINELANSCSLLKQLLDTNTVSAKSLAAALTLIENGTLGFDQLTDALLKALDAGTSFEEMLRDVQDWIQNFNKGTDLTEGTKHIISSLDELKEYVDNWEFGNEPTEKIYDHIFGEGAYQKLVDKFGTDFEAFEAFVDKKIEKYTDMAKNAGLGGIQQAAEKGVAGLKEIAGSGGKFFEWDLTQFDSTTDAINSVAKALGVSQEAAEAFILSWQSHMPKLRTEWNELDYETKLTAFANELSDTRVVTKEQLAALGAAVGKTSDEVAANLSDIITKINKARIAAGKDPIEIPVIVNWKDDNGKELSGDALKKKFAETFGTQRIDYGSNGREVNYDVDYAQYAADFTSELQNGIEGVTNGIDAEGLIGRLLEDGFSPTQANEMADTIAQELDDSMLTKKITIPKLADDGVTITSEEVTVTADSMEGLTVAADAALEAANYEVAAQKLAESDLSGLSKNVTSTLNSAIQTVADKMGGTVESAASKVGTAVEKAGEDATENLKTYIANTQFKGQVTLTATGSGTGATGGFVRSFANGFMRAAAEGQGDHFLQPGFALTGEEGQEIVWNKEKGYAYITGANGPEFQNLQPGDRVFNAAETQRIFRNSSFAKGGYFDSFADGGWKDDGTGGSKYGATTTGKDSSSWSNKLDWLYNLMEDIAEYERKQTLLQTRYEMALEDSNKTGKDLYKITRDQLNNLYNQQRMQTEAYKRRSQEMSELESIQGKKKVGSTGNKFQDYARYNEKDKTVEIDWDKINAIKDQDDYNAVTDYIKSLEDVQKKMEDAESSLLDIESQIKELENRFLDAYTEFQDRVLNAVVADRQAQIDNLSELNKTLNDANNNILASLQEEIAVQRQIRENTKTEENIADMEARLAYLQRDTTGANDSEIRQLQQQISEARENYSDTLVDQSLERLSKDNEDAAKQREHQIELMQAQLDYDQKSGALWDEVNKLIENGIYESTGSLKENSKLYELLQRTEDWGAMSEEQRQSWADELMTDVNQVGAYLMQQKLGLTVTEDKIGSLDDTNGGMGATPATTRGDNVKKKRERPDLERKYGDPLAEDTGYGTDYRSIKYRRGVTYTEGTGKWGDREKSNNKISTVASSGTLVTGSADLLKSGPQKIDTSAGVLVKSALSNLSDKLTIAKSNDSFVKLADVASKAIASKESIVSNAKTDNTFNISVDVGSISDDYDVDKMVDRIKSDLFAAASYRNVNAIGLTK